MNPFKKSKHYNTIQAITYTALALALMIMGIVTKNSRFLIGALIVGACDFYWILRKPIFLSD